MPAIRLVADRYRADSACGVREKINSVRKEDCKQVYESITNANLCIEKVAAMECKYTNDVARCDVDMNGTCQLDAGVFCCTNYGRRGSTPD